MKRSTVKRNTVLLAAASAILLSSCIGIDADARIAADGSVELAIVYTVSSAVDELGKLGANAGYLPLPVGRNDLELAATRAGGELRSWSRDDGAESFTIRSSLRFPNAAAFAAFLDPAGQSASYAEAGGRSTLTIRLSEGFDPADGDMLEFVRLAFADYAVNLKFTVPRTPTAADGLALSGRAATFSMKAADLYASSSPVTISLSW